MSDLIDRQAAIDAINHICPVDTEYDCTLLDRVDVRCVLSDLPSVQPEIIRCKDCDYWNERQGRMYCGEMYFDQDDPNFYCGYARRRTDG